MKDEAPRLASESERRQATVLFADISGFTAMAEKMDPEEITAVINYCLSALAAVVGAHGGRVDKYIGDCIMAVFGVPALERAPQHAIEAAIEMRHRVALMNHEQRLRVPVDVHVGINTGLVIAGQIGGDVKQEFTVIGDAVNVAARLKDVAKGGTIYVGPETHRYTRDDFEFRKLPPVALKGKEHPVEAYEVLSAKERRPALGSSERMIVSPLVGREQELTLLKACVTRLLGGQGGIINLIGEAGLGKSRLLAEFVASEHSKDVMFLEGRSLSIGQGLSFHPFIDLIKHWAAISQNDDEQESRSKLETCVERLFPGESGEIFPFVATLVGMRLGGVHAARIEGIAGEALERLILKSMRLLLQRMAQAQPLVLIFEDLHWADLSSIQLLETLLQLVPDHRILFIHAFRPDHSDTSARIRRAVREQWGPYRTEIVLEPLDDPGCATLIRNLLKAEDLPSPVLALIARTAEGNPFYIEEVVRSLIDEGALEYVKGQLRVTERVDSVVIPDTIEGVIMARVDRLAEPTRHLLQVASVLGRSFYYRLLAAMMPPGTDLDAELAQLKERQLLFERTTRRTSTMRRQMLRAEVEYVFKHALVQETVYESMLQKKRKELHHKVAETIELIFADRIADFSGMLAYHFSRADNLPKAEEYLFRAGDEAARAAASNEALAFFREASKLYFFMHGAGGDPKKKALLEKNIGLALLNKGDHTESIEHFDQALRHLGEPVPTSRLAVAAHIAVDLPAVLAHVYLRGWKRGRAQQLAPGLRDSAPASQVSLGAPPPEPTRPAPASAVRAGAELAVQGPAPLGLDHEREVCELFFHRGHAEVTSDPRRLFFELFTGLRRFNRLDPSTIDQACAMYVSCAGIFAYSGLSFTIAERMLEVAAGLIRAGSIQDSFVYRAMCFTCHYLQGHWDEKYAIADDLVEQALRYGQVWDVTLYLGLDCDRRLRQGDFAAARRLLAKLIAIKEEYGYIYAGSNHDGTHAILSLEERKLADALRESERHCEVSQEGTLKVMSLGMIAKARVLLGDRAGAAASLARAADTSKRAGVVSPWHQSPYVVAQVLFDLTALEDCAQRADRSGWRFKHAALRSARRAVRVAARVAKERTEIYNLNGRLWWVLGRRKHARVWWAKSIAEGERMGARPELARTYLDIGRRLPAGESLNGMHRADYVQKARQLFRQLGLEWDLKQLESIAARSTEPALPTAANVA